MLVQYVKQSMISNAIKIIAACAVFMRANASFAHEGHGLSGSHWHASDVWGFVALAAVVALAIWFSRGDK
jgi:hypothetical protein